MKLDTGDQPGLVDRYMAALLSRLGSTVRLRRIRSHTTLGANFQIGSGSGWADFPPKPRRLCPVSQRAIRLQPSDPAEADRLWARLDRRITNQAPWRPAVQPAWISVVSARVGGYQ